MSQVLIEYINDVIEETSDEYGLIFGKTMEEITNVKESYNYLFTGISVFAAFIIALTSTSKIELSVGISILFIDLVSGLLILLKRQRRMRKLNDAYGEHISILGQKKRRFLKIRKDIHYWEYITKPFPPNVIRNSLIALETIDSSYELYKIGIYERLFPLLTLENKKIIFWATLKYIKASISFARDLQHVSSKLLPFFIQNEIRDIFNDNRKYIPDYFMLPNAEPNYEIYVNSRDYVELRFDGALKFIKKYGFKVFALYNKAIKPYEFLLDEDFNIVKYRLKGKN